MELISHGSTVHLLPQTLGCSHIMLTQNTITSACLHCSCGTIKKTRTRGCLAGCNASSLRFTVNLILSLVLRRCRLHNRQGEKQFSNTPICTFSSAYIKRDWRRVRGTISIPAGKALKTLKLLSVVEPVTQATTYEGHVVAINQKTNTLCILYNNKQADYIHPLQFQYYLFIYFQNLLLASDNYKRWTVFTSKIVVDKTNASSMMQWHEINWTHW